LQEETAMFEIYFYPPAEKDFAHLHPELQSELKNIHFAKLSLNPHIGKPLKGEFKGFWKYAITFKGVAHRIIYEIDRGRVIIAIMMIGTRETVYKRLRSRIR